MQNWKIVLFKKKVSDMEPSLKIQNGSYVVPCVHALLYVYFYAKNIC